MRDAADSAALLGALSRHEVAYIVVGMTAGVLQGAPLVTLDVDILYERAPENVARLAAVLTEIDARFRGDPRRIRPNLSHLESKGHKLLETRFGDLDVLGTVDDDLEYADLIGDTITLDLDGLDVQVLSLRRLIEVKQRAGRAKDLAALPVLRSTLERIEQQR